MLDSKKPQIDVKDTVYQFPQGTGENVAVAGGLPMADFLRSAFGSLNEHGLDWAILRNATGLPEYTRYDIDMLVRRRDLDAIEETFKKIAVKFDWKLVGIIRKRNYTCLLFCSSSNPRQFLPIDLFADLEFRTCKIVDSDVVFSTRRRENLLWSVSPGADAATTLMKELLPHGKLKANSRAEVCKGATEEQVVFCDALRPILGETLTTEVYEAVSKSDWKSVEKMSSQIRVKTMGFRWSGLHARIQFLWMNLRHLLRRKQPSVVIALAAPDGSGKTAFCDRVANSCYKRPFKSCRYLHMHLGVLPTIQSVKNFARRLLGIAPVNRVQSAPGTRHSGMGKPAPAVQSMIIATYYSIELALGRFKIARMRAQWSLVLFDRHFYDYYYQLGHLNCPSWYLRFLEFFIPKPNLLIFLDRDARSIYDQKPELEVHEIERQQAIINRLVETRSFAVRIDGNHGVEQTADTGIELVYLALGIEKECHDDGA